MRITNAVVSHEKEAASHTSSTDIARGVDVPRVIGDGTHSLRAYIPVPITAQLAVGAVPLPRVIGGKMVSRGASGLVKIGSYELPATREGLDNQARRLYDYWMILLYRVHQIGTGT